MNRTATILITLTALSLMAAMPAVATEKGSAPSAAQTRAEPLRSVSVVKATGVVRRSINVYPYVSYRLFDPRAGRLYALVSFGSPFLLERHVGERVTVYGTRVPGYPRGSGPPLLDVFRVVPLKEASS